MNSQVKSVHYQILRVRVPLRKCLFAGGLCMFTDALFMCIHWKREREGKRGNSAASSTPGTMHLSLSLPATRREGGRKESEFDSTLTLQDRWDYTLTHIAAAAAAAASLVSVLPLCTVRAVVTEMYSQPFFFTCPFNLPPTHLLLSFCFLLSLSASLSPPVPAGWWDASPHPTGKAICTGFIALETKYTSEPLDTAKCTRQVINCHQEANYTLPCIYFAFFFLFFFLSLSTLLSVSLAYFSLDLFSPS